MTRSSIAGLISCALLLPFLGACGSSGATLSTTLKASTKAQSLRPGEIATYVATITNKGPGSVQNVTLHVDLPNGFLYAATNSVSGDGSRTLPDDPAKNSPSPEWGLWSLPAPTSTQGIQSFSSISITFSAQVGGTPGQYDIIARSAGDNATGDTSPPTVLVTVAAAPNLSLRVSAQPTSAHIGDSITYKVIVSNSGSGNANTFEILASLPAGFTYQATTNVSGNSARGTNLTPKAGAQLPFWGDFTVPARSDSGTGTLTLSFTAQIAKGTPLGSYPITVQVTDDQGDQVTANKVVPVTVS